jgi:membrane fusion protein (multidrug efflux system)
MANAKPNSAESRDGDRPRSAEDQAGDEEPKKDRDEPGKPPKKPFYKRPVLMTILIVVAVAVIIIGVLWWLHSRQYENTDDAFIDGHIVYVAPRVAGRVLKLNVTDNQWVDAGAVIVEIDPADYIAAKDQALAAEQQATAKVAQAQANLAVAQADAEQAQADVLVAQANAANAQADLQRFQKLPAQARSKQQLDNAIAAEKTASATVIAKQKQSASAQAQVRAAQTAIDAAQAQVKSAQAQTAQANLNLQYTKVTAGQAGYVTRRTIEAGNYVQVGQNLAAIVSEEVWVTANFKETQLTNMHPNDPVTIHVDAYPGHEFKGHVDSIQAGTGAVFSLIPPENATGNYVKVVQRVPVKIVFDDDSKLLLAPGMSVEPKVKVR